MYYPSREQFTTLAKKGNLIPVYKEITADLETPVSAFLKIDTDANNSFLLESVEGGEKWARYCFLGTNPSIIFECRGKKVRIIRNGHSTESLSEHGPIEALKKLMAPYKPVFVPGLPRFYGGAVGFFGYDVVKFIEKIPATGEDDLDLPDALFIVTDTMLIFDNVNKSIKVVSNVHIDDLPLDAAYEEATKKIDALIERLNMPIKQEPYEVITSQPEQSVKFSSNTTKEQFKNSVLACKNYIKEGDIFQVVLSQRLKIDLQSTPFDIYRSLRRLNPSPYMYYLKFGNLKIVGSSPEVMVRLEEDKVEVRPIAGTRPRGKNDKEDLSLSKDLLADPKECAEHIMLVDLGRNDVGRVTELGQVSVDQLKVIEKYSHVIHIVSNVSGKLKKGCDCYDVLKATFPAGTVSGAPKIRAMEIIDEMEPTKRGIYAGAVGYVSFSGNMDTAISIRTLVIIGNSGYLGVGAGIVADSIPEKEYEETINKGKALLRAIEIASREKQ